MARDREPTGFVRVVERTGGPVFYAQVRTATGKRLQRKLGKAWTKRSRPPKGYLTERQAESKLAEILAGRIDDVPVDAKPGDDVTFKQACDEWLRYVEFDRKRRPSTIRDYKREIKARLIPRFGANTPLSEIGHREIEAFRQDMLDKGKFSARTINKRLQQLHTIFTRAQRVWELPLNPVARVERQPQQRSGDFQVLEPLQVEQLAGAAANPQDAVIFTVAAFSGLRLGETTWIEMG